MASYFTGTTVRLTAEFKDRDGSLFDPSPGPRLIINDVKAVKHTYRYPTDAIIVKDSTGEYHADLSIPSVGTIQWAWACDQTGQESYTEGHFDVKPRSL